MNLFERTLLRFLLSSKIKMEISGFDVESFKKAMHQGLRDRLDTIECIILQDGDTASDAEKVAAIKLLFERDFYA